MDPAREVPPAEPADLLVPRPGSLDPWPASVLDEELPLDVPAVAEGSRCGMFRISLYRDCLFSEGYNGVSTC